MLKNLISFLLVTAALVHGETLVQLLEATPDLSTLLSLVSKFPALVTTLTSAKDITVFAPTNEAFACLLKENPNLANEPDVIEAVLTYHVAPEKIPAQAIPAKTFVHTLLTNTTYSLVTGGQVVEAERKGDKVSLISGEGAVSDVVKANVFFDNGVAHIIDKVLTIPPDIATIAAADGLTTLATALTETGLLNTVNTLPDSTVFAPTNAAFAELGTLPSGAALAKVLEYHVVNGTVAYSTLLKNGEEVPTVEGSDVRISIFDFRFFRVDAIFVNLSLVVKRDVLVKTGVVHVINRVLMPPS